MPNKHKKPKLTRSERLLANRKERMKKLYEMMGGHVCGLCEKEHPPCALEFHHKNPAEKKFSISRHVLNKSWEAVKEEAKKCVILCSNCHKIAHKVKDKLFTE